MDNNDKKLLEVDFPSNSQTSAGQSRSKKADTEKKLKKVVTGTVKKKKRSFGKKMAETLLEDDTKSVGSYIFYDVLIPAAKALISDTVGGGIEMLLFGEKRGNRTRRDGGRSYTNYGSYSYSSSSIKSRDSRDRPREMTRAGRARHDFDEIVLETRGEAEEVLSHLVDLTIDYGQATVADLYDLVGITSDFTDQKYGWIELHDANVQRVRGGYLINLPRTRPLD